MLKKLRVSIRFTNVESLTMSLSECFPTYMYVSKNAADIQVGYVSPGHGARGRHQWISDNFDIEDMCKEYQGKKEITVWFYSSNHQKKKLERVRDKHTWKSWKQQTAPNSSTYTEKIQEVESILKKVKDSHAGSYTEEKLQTWAHLIQIEKHNSYSQPPDMPYFKKGKKDTPTTTPTPPSSASPSKWVSMRTACIEQLINKWHSLLEKGGITKQRYNQLQDKIKLRLDSESKDLHGFRNPRAVVTTERSEGIT